MKKVIITILCILFIAGIGFGVYFGFYKKDSNQKKEYTQTDFYNVVKDELDILYGKMNLAIDNDEITVWAYQRGDFFDKDTFSLSDMQKILNDSSLRNLNLKFTNLYDHGGNYFLDRETVCAKLENGIYKTIDYNPCAHGATTIYPFYSKTVGFKEENGKYIISIKNVFTYGGDGGPANSYYYTFEDALNSEDEDVEDLLTYDYDDNEYEAKKYIKDNWDDIEKYLDTYVYTFKVENNSIILTNYERVYAPDHTSKENKAYYEEDHGGLLCEGKDINCYIDKFLVELSYNDLDLLKQPDEAVINMAIFYYLRDIGNANELFVYDDDKTYFKIDKDLLDTIVYIMFGKTDFDNYQSINEIEGLFKINDYTYEMRQIPKGGYRHTIKNKTINKINDDEYEVKLYFEGGQEDGIVSESESGTYHLKYNEDEEVFYVQSVK